MTALFTVGQRIEMYLNLPCNAFQTTLATYAGQNIGAGKMQNVKQDTRQTLMISLAMSLAISVAVWLSADAIIGLSGLGSQAMVYCRAHLRTIAVINLVLGAYLPLSFPPPSGRGKRRIVRFLLRISFRTLSGNRYFAVTT